MSNVKQVLEDFEFLWAVCSHWTSAHVITVRRWSAPAILVQETTRAQHERRTHYQFPESCEPTNAWRASDHGETIRELIGNVRKSHSMKRSEKVAHVIAHRITADGVHSYALWVLPN